MDFDLNDCLKSNKENVFANNLKNIRESKNMSRTEFSEFLDIPYSTYNGYEGQGKEPKYNNLVKIAEKLDVSLDELLGVKLPSKEEAQWKEVRKYLKILGITIEFYTNFKQSKTVTLRIPAKNHDFVLMLSVAKSELINVVNALLKEIEEKNSDIISNSLYKLLFNKACEEEFKKKGIVEFNECKESDKEMILYWMSLSHEERKKLETFLFIAGSSQDEELIDDYMKELEKRKKENSHKSLQEKKS